MGMEEFEGAEFEKQVKEITAFPNGSLACHFYGGEVKHGKERDDDTGHA